MPEGKQIRPFVDWLEAHKKGEVDTELTYELRQVIDAVMETGKAGELTLKLKIKPAGRAQQVTVIEEITAKAPKPSRADSLYFVDQNSNLVRDDPRQGVLTPFNRAEKVGEAK